jgi:hypothetical protein
LDEIKGIIFCAVIGPIIGMSSNLSHAPGDFIISNKGIGIDDRHRDFHLLGSDHVWLEYFVPESPQLKVDSTLQVEFYIDPYSLFIHSCGVHVIHKHEENAKDRPSMIQVDFNFSFYDRWSETVECSGHDEFEDYEFKRAERLLYGIQSKRCRDDDDDDDSNLKSGLHPQQKRRSSTLGESQLNQSENSQHSHLPTYFGKDPLMLITC